jgi:hypothetical protein
MDQSDVPAVARGPMKDDAAPVVRRPWHAPRFMLSRVADTNLSIYYNTDTNAAQTS